MLKNVKIRILVFFFFCLSGLVPSLQAQVAEVIDHMERATVATDQIYDLRQGTLVVKLPTKRNNIKAIDKALSSDKLREKTKIKLLKKREAIIAECTRINLQITKAVTDHYQFSNYRFIPDTASTQLKNGVSRGYFLNTQGELDDSISIDLDKPVFFLRFGVMSSPTTNRSEGFVVTDHKGNTLQKPFPYFIKSKYPPFSSAVAFFGNGDVLFPNFQAMALKFNQKLTKFYAKRKLAKEKEILREKMQELKN